MEGYYRDDGTPFNPNLKPKPALCATCRKNDDQKYEIQCDLTRADQDEDIFICFAYESAYGENQTKTVLQDMEDHLNKKYDKGGR